MKQKITALGIFILILGSAMAQAPKDTTEKVKTVYIFDHSDTIKVNTLLYKGDGNTVKWCSPGWQIVKGRAYIEDKKRYWVEDPQVIGALDDKRRPVKAIN